MGLFVVTTGPVTVPLVLALGIGVCRVVSSGNAGGGHSGFGIVTLASLFPILAVLLLSLFHYVAEDYYGAENYQGEPQQVTIGDNQEAELKLAKNLSPISSSEFNHFSRTGELPNNYSLEFRGGSAELQDGKITVTQPDVIVKKLYKRDYQIIGAETWDKDLEFIDGLKLAFFEALRAIIPLCLFLYIVLRMVLKQKMEQSTDVGIGVVFALLGMAHVEGPFFHGHGGKLLAVGFAFFLGYGATLAEPALNALGDTVERITVGAFPKKLLMQRVALGVGMCIAAGIFKMAYNLPLFWMLLPPYLVVIALTWISPHSFVNFGWDSAGVTTGPIIVPLVLAMGLGIGANVPGVNDGFGILALASVGPILTVLTVGLYTQHQERANSASDVADLDSPTPHPLEA